MNAILRKVVLPSRKVSGMGTRSYMVLTEWNNRHVITQGSSPPVVFSGQREAEAFALKECASWPYRSEALFLTDDGMYLPITDVK